MAMRKKAKRKVNRDLPIVGGSGELEPTLTEEQTGDRDFFKALNWYDVRWEPRDYRVSADAYSKHLGITDAKSAITQAKIDEMRIFAITGRLVMNGQHVTERHANMALEQLDKLKTKYARKPTEKVTRKRPSVHEHSIQKAKVYGAHIDGEIDGFLENKCTSDFDTKKYLLAEVVPGKIAKMVSEFYTDLAFELEQALTGTDEQLVEGYAFLEANDLYRYYEFVSGIIRACTDHVKLMKSQRKPRKSKTKTVDKVVEKIKSKNRDNELDLDSIDPRKIIGTSELWVYDTKTRKLSVFYAMDEAGLGVKNTSITNYKLGSSAQKTLRKPAEFFKNLASTKKRAMKQAWSEVNGKELKIKTSRINDNMILLAAN